MNETEDSFHMPVSVSSVLSSYADFGELQRKITEFDSALFVCEEVSHVCNSGCCHECYR